MITAGAGSLNFWEVCGVCPLPDCDTGLRFAESKHQRGVPRPHIRNACDDDRQVPDREEEGRSDALGGADVRLRRMCRRPPGYTTTSNSTTPAWPQTHGTRVVHGHPPVKQRLARGKGSGRRSTSSHIVEHHKYSRLSRDRQRKHKTLQANVMSDGLGMCRAQNRYRMARTMEGSIAASTETHIE